jgi:arylsulfatase A-like enzyme
MLRLLLPLLACVLAPAASAAPNVVVILADDLGVGDVKCYNPAGKIPTPNLDRLAAEGVRFTDAHSGSAVCTPTRYGLLTGRYAWRTKLQNGVLGGLSPRLIAPGRETIASLLKKQGYHTACVGKWHLGLDWTLKPGKQVSELNIEPREQVFNVEYDQPFAGGPLAVGFDYYFGISASLDMVPYTFLENDRVAANPTEDKDFAMMKGRPGRGRNRKGPTAPGFDAADVLPKLRDKAVEYVASRKGAGKPFFLYLPLTAPHTPILPTDDWDGKSKLNPYADFVMHTDAVVGDVLAALEKNGFAKDTLVIVTSDNGCSPQADFPELLRLGHNPSHVYRGTKADIFEGGHRVPFLARWPGVAPPGQVSDHLVCLTDVFRTCCEVGGAAVPDAAGEDSFSIRGVLTGNQSGPLRASIVNHSINGSFAIRDGDWKLCLCPGSGGWSAPRPNRDDASTLPKQQLFNLKQDIGEMKNREADEPGTVTRLLAMLDKQVADGRSTPGASQKNDVAVDVWKAGTAATKPMPKKK